jgi:hypothetical protein
MHNKYDVCGNLAEPNQKVKKMNILHIFAQDVALPDQTLAYHDT